MIQLTGTVRNGKIEVAAPSELADGTRVALLMLNSTVPDTEQMDDSELLRTLAAMESFAAAYPEDQDGEDLSQAARESAKLQESQPTGKNPSLMHELKDSGASLSEEATPG